METEVAQEEIGGCVASLVEEKCTRFVAGR